MTKLKNDAVDISVVNPDYMEILFPIQNDYRVRVARRQVNKC